MTIIYGTDFSPGAVRAGRVAADLARRLDGTLEVVHACEAAGLGAITPMVRESLMAQVHGSLEREVESLRATGARIASEVVSGMPDEVIVQRAGRDDARLVVIGSLGRRTGERWLLGSVAERVAETSPVPTLVVREDETLREWTAGKRSLRVLCACDFTAIGDAVLEVVKVLRGIGDCEVVVAHVNWPWGEGVRLGIPEPSPMSSNHPVTQRVLERDLKEKVSSRLGQGGFRIRIEPSPGRPDFRLVEMAKEEGADLVVTGTHQWHGLERLWHGSTSRGLLRYAPMNVLVVPGPAVPAARPLPELRRVLVPTDLSPLGNEAIPHAFSLVKQGGIVCVLHVEAPAERKPDSASRVRALIPLEAAARGIASEVEVVLHDDPSAAICQAAERFGADAICLTTHGRSGVSAALFGSVAQGVLSASHRPIYLVRARPS